MMQLDNVTDSYFNVSQNGGQKEEADPWILAKSFLTYKIGKSVYYYYYYSYFDQKVSRTIPD